MAVYFFQPGDYPVVKIGTSRNPQQRTLAFAANLWTDLNIIRVVAGGYGEERWLHSRFGEYRLRGEWFRLVPEMMTIKIPAAEVRALRLNPYQRRIIVREGIEAGRSYAALARQIGISRERVRQYAEEAGLKGETSNVKVRLREAAKEQARIEKQAAADKLFAENQAAFQALVGQGVSFRKAAVALGFRPQTGHAWAVNLGLEARHSKWQNDLEERKARAVDLIRSGVTYADAARLTRLSYPTVKKSVRLAESAHA